MKKIKILLPVLAFAFYSCDQYMDINSPSPNNVAYENVTPANLLPGAQTNAYRVQSITMNQLGNVFMNSWTRNVAAFGNGYDRELQLILDNSFYGGIFEGIYRNLMNFQGIIDYPDNGTKYNNYKAAALICKSYYMQYVVDLYGDVPYSQAWKGQNNITPAYDDDFVVYQSLFDNLDQARQLIADNSSSDDISTYDVMCGGDMAKWEKFANTIQLKMCLQMSKCTNPAQVALRDAKLAEISSSNNFLTDSVLINPGYNASTTAQVSPGVATFLYNLDGSSNSTRTFNTITGHAYKALSSYATTNWADFGNNYEVLPGTGVNYPNITDPRRNALWTAGLGATARRAVTQGSSTVDVYPVGSSGLPARQSYIGNYNLYGQFSPSVVTDIFVADGAVMLYSEVCFMLAEAAARAENGETAYAGFSGAQTWFNAGVTDNFAARNATIGTYLTNINTKPWFGYTASTTFDQKLHAIMYQKWIATMGLNGMVSYLDYIRTGFPYTPLSTNATQTRKPYRLIYPNSEYIANSANVPNVTSSDCFTINSKTPFWLQ